MDKQQTASIPTGSGKSFIAGLFGDSACKECGSTDLFWATHYQSTSGVPEGRLRTNEVKCTFVQGCNICSETLRTISAEQIASKMTKAISEA